MTSIAAFRYALGRFGFTAAAVTATKRERLHMMEDIILGINSGFKTMPKTMRDHTDVNTQDAAGKNFVTNAPVVVSACTE